MAWRILLKNSNKEGLIKENSQKNVQTYNIVKNRATNTPKCPGRSLWQTIQKRKGNHKTPFAGTGRRHLKWIQDI